jgi:hypothetical protein
VSAVRPQKPVLHIEKMICILPGHQAAGVQKNETIDTEIALMTTRSV